MFSVDGGSYILRNLATNYGNLLLKYMEYFMHDCLLGAKSPPFLSPFIFSQS